MVKCCTGQPTSVSIKTKYHILILLMLTLVLYREAKTPLLSFNGAFDRGITDAVLGTN